MLAVLPDTPENSLGDWHGQACDEAEGTYIYRWSVDLMQDPDTSQIVGTVKFHACPGGGRVLYYVVGEPTADPIFTLAGTKKDGGGELYNNAANRVTLTFDTTLGQITPNLAP